MHPHRGDQVAILDGTATGAHSLDGDGAILCIIALGDVIAICGLKIGGERHGAVTKLSIQTDDRIALADVTAGTPDLQGHIAAHGGHGLHTGHADRVFRITVRHDEVAGLGGLVAETVAERHRHRVGSVGKLHTIQVDVAVAGYQCGLLRHIGAVHIEAHGVGIHAGGILAGCIAEFGAQVEGASADRAAVHQLLIVEGDGVHLRVVDIICICAIHKLEIVKVDRADPRLNHFSSCNKHKAEGLTLQQGKGRI